MCTQYLYKSNPKDTAKQSMRKFGNFYQILVNYLPDSAVPLELPYFKPTLVRWYAGSFCKI